MIDIKVCPSTLAEGFDTYCPKATARLFGGRRTSPMLDFAITEFLHGGDAVSVMKRISVSGVQEKFAAVADDGHIRIARTDERSTHILKPAPWDETLANRKQIPANEHLTMQIAAQVYGIPTADNGMCFTKDGQMVYITRRFDITPEGQKVQMEDFATLIGRNEQTAGSEFKYHGSYEEIATALRNNVAAWKIDMERFFTLIVFNYIYGNADAHAKNFSIIRQGADYRLAPAYDLLNTSLHVGGDDFALDGGLSSNLEKSDVYAQTGHPCRLDFARFGHLIGLTDRRTDRILDGFTSLPTGTETLVAHSFLNDKMKRTYLRTASERIKRFARESE